MTKPLRFTVDIAPDPEHPTTWVATCVELGSTSAARSPQDAFAAAASGLRLMVNAILDKRGTPGAGLEVLREIEAGYVQLRREAMPRPVDPDAPHRWIQGSPYEACAVCGKTKLAGEQKMCKACRISRHADNSEQRLLDRARRLAADPFGEY